MKWIQFLLIIFLLLGFPLFQGDQLIDINWVICDNTLVIKSESKEPRIEKIFWPQTKPKVSFFNQRGFIYQLKNSISFLISSFKGTSPFWRPPPETNLS
jgi:hypothetical protein